MHTHITCTHTGQHAHTHTYTCVRHSGPTCTHALLHTHTHAYTYAQCPSQTCTCTHVHMYIPTHINTPCDVQILMHTHTHTHTHAKPPGWVPVPGVSVGGGVARAPSRSRCVRWNTWAHFGHGSPFCFRCFPFLSSLLGPVPWMTEQSYCHLILSEGSNYLLIHNLKPDSGMPLAVKMMGSK